MPWYGWIILGVVIVVTALIILFFWAMDEPPRDGRPPRSYADDQGRESWKSNR